MSLAKLTSKGQITIPKDVRDALGIEQSDYVIVVIDGDKAILSPVRSGKLSELKGKLKANKAYPGTQKTREEVGRELGRRMDQTAQ